jgi:peptidoglycan/xylan/chitin deacetylase (PgdA/CDA1 family)
MPHKWIKTAAAGALHWSGADRLVAAGTGAGRSPLVIGYHKVVEDFAASAARSMAPLLISARTLERHLDWIGRRFDFVTLDDLAAGLEGTRRFDRPVAAITFDDGYRDVYEHALPLLVRKGIPAAAFVPTDLVGTGRLLLHDELYLLLSGAFTSGRRARVVELLAPLAIFPAGDVFGTMRVLLEALPQAELRRITGALRAEVEIPEAALREARLLDWEMLRDMSRKGMTIGAHTRTHPFLTNETREKALDETVGARRAAERALGTKVEHFAYPDGRFDESVVQAVAAAGYRAAYTTCRHRDARYPALTVPRRSFWENSCLDALGRFSPALMSCQVSGVLDLVAPCRQSHGGSVPCVA